VKGTGYPLHSPVSPSIPLPCVTVCHHISSGLYFVRFLDAIPLESKHVAWGCLSPAAYFSRFLFVWKVRHNDSCFGLVIYDIRFNCTKYVISVSEKKTSLHLHGIFQGNAERWNKRKGHLKIIEKLATIYCLVLCQGCLDVLRKTL